MSPIPPLPPSDPGPPAGSPASWGSEHPRPRLARRRTDKVLGGVCGGLADHLGIDATFVRVAAVLLALTGWGILLYLVAWAALPQADPDAPRPPVHRFGGLCARCRIPWLPVIIVVVALFTVPTGFSVIFGGGHFGNATVPILVLCVVAYLMWRATHGESPLPRRHGGGFSGGPGGGWQAPPPSTTTTTSASGPSPAAAAALAGTEPSTTSRPLWAGGDDHDQDSASPAAPTGPAGDAGEPDEDPLLAEARRMSDPFLTEPLLFETAPPAASAAAAAPPSRHPRRGGGRAFLAALLIGAGAVGLAWALGVSLSPFTVLAGLLIAFGSALVFGGFSGRSNRGLIIPGLVVFGLLSLAGILDFDLPAGGAGERVYEPKNLSAVETTYELGVGELLLDLSAVDFPTTGPFEIEARIGAGQLTVTVPDDITVNVEASAGAGSLMVFERTSEGVNPDLDVTEDGAEGAGVLNLDVSVGLGEIVVDRP
ncbi:MAG: PspC domain-containing protein [Acidimicrobiales bacterium]